MQNTGSPHDRSTPITADDSMPSESVLTTPDYWESGYVSKSGNAPLDLDGFRNFGDRKVVEKVESLGLENRSVLEIGAGNSAILSHLASKYGARATFSGLDYSASGCALLRQRAEREGAVIDVFHQDLFEPEPALLGRFDAVYSYGVVEHFQSLATVLRAKMRFLRQDGRMLSIIPNMAGVLGTLTRRYNRQVYDVHVPHDLNSFLQGHVEAELEVIESGYICSTNFGVLASCFNARADRGWSAYVWLTRFTKLLWLFECRFGELPHSAQFSPYIYAISHNDR